MEKDAKGAPSTDAYEQLQGTRRCDFLMNLPGHPSWEGTWRPSGHGAEVVVQGAGVSL